MSGRRVMHDVDQYGVAHCKSCEAPIHWARTDSGKLMPVDAEPVLEGGNLVLYREHGVGELRVRVEGGGPGHRYRPHFATCPNAATHRRPR